MVLWMVGKTFIYLTISFKGHVDLDLAPNVLDPDPAKYVRFNWIRIRQRCLRM